MSKVFAVLLLFFLGLLNLTSALYFHIGETERKCFIEEVPDETAVMSMKLSLK